MYFKYLIEHVSPITIKRVLLLLTVAAAYGVGYLSHFIGNVHTAAHPYVFRIGLLAIIGVWIGA